MNTLANGNMCKRRKVFSFNSELYKVTGVQKVLMDIHHAVKEDYDAIIVGTGGKLNAALDDFVPSGLVHGIEVLVAYIVLQQPEDDACIEVVARTDGADRFQRRNGVFFGNCAGTQ